MDAKKNSDCFRTSAPALIAMVVILRLDKFAMQKSLGQLIPIGFYGVTAPQISVEW